MLTESLDSFDNIFYILQPLLWHLIYQVTGHQYVVLEVAVYALCLLFAAAIVAIAYKESLRRVVVLIADSIYKLLSKIFNLNKNKRQSA